MFNILHLNPIIIIIEKKNHTRELLHCESFPGIPPNILDVVLKSMLPENV